MATHCADRRRTLVFLPLIATSQKMRDILVGKGIRAGEVNGMSRDRAQILADYARGKYDVLCNRMLLTEGYDCPEIDCVIPLRATKVRSLFCQMVGRGTRVCEGKDHLLLIDFLWNTAKHDLCRPAHLIAEDDQVSKKMTDQINEAEAAVDLEQAEEKAAADCVQEREEALAKKLAEQRNKKQKLVDPLQYEMSIQAEDLANYVPAFGWEMAPATDKQIDALERAGICSIEIGCAGKAAKLLDKLSMRRADGLTTPKQIRFLEGRGFQHVGTWQFDAAKRLIDRIAASGWRVPSGISPTNYKP
jgi:excinuclease UvrABC helicase subunit UvrB